MAELLNRVCTTTIGSVRWNGLRTTFRVMATADRHPNTLELSLFALNQEHRGQLGEKGAELRLVAGYPDTASLLFAGTVTRAYNVKQSGGWVGIVEARDGDAAWQARVSASYAKSTKNATLAKKLAEQMGFVLTAAQLAMIGSGAQPDATVMHGPASLEFQELMRSLGLEWSIQGGVLQITTSGEPTSEAVRLLTPSTGLVGNIEREAAKAGQPAGLRWKSLLDPEARPGRHVKAESASWSGFARIDKATHLGDTHGGDWYTECEGHEV